MIEGNCQILVIEDELAIRRFLQVALSHEGYRVMEATSGLEGIKLAVHQPPDLIILDLGLPDQDGQEVLLKLREWYTGPLIILSARDQENQKILALDQGADDFITKPFGVGELLARIRTAFRHSHPVGNISSEVLFGELRVDLAARQVFRGEKLIHLTPLEYKVFITLIKNPGKVLTHRYLLKEVWGPQDSQEFHYLRVFIASLRKKIEKDPAQPQFIITETGVGYRFVGL